MFITLFTENKIDYKHGATNENLCRYDWYMRVIQETTFGTSERI